MTDTIYLIEQLTTDKKDYTVTGVTPILEHAIALAGRNNNCNISEWKYDSHLLQYRYQGSYNSKGEAIKDD